MLNQIDNFPLKSGFIFIQVDEVATTIPLIYLAYRLGGFGYFAKLNPTNANGYEAVTFQEYEDVGK